MVLLSFLFMNCMFSFWASSLVFLVRCSQLCRELLCCCELGIFQESVLLADHILDMFRFIAWRCFRIAMRFAIALLQICVRIDVFQLCGVHRRAAFLCFSVFICALLC